MKTFVANLIQDSTGISGVAADAMAGGMVDAIVAEMKRSEGFTVTKIKARTARNPGTGEPIKVKAGKTVRFKASPMLEKPV